MAFGTVVLFLIFGIKPLAVTTASNKKVLAELNTIEQKLENKLQKISTSLDKLDLLSEQIDILNQRVPQTITFEEYLEGPEIAVEGLLSAAGLEVFKVGKLGPHRTG